jgi:hypothetical protein
MTREKHPTLPSRRPPMPPPGTPEHEEWLIDEAGDESFPASDSPAPAKPGGLPEAGEAPKKK